MKCPSCNEGELFLYKEAQCVYRIPLTKQNTISKRKNHNVPTTFDVQDFLECDNYQCGTLFYYDLNEKEQIDKDSLYKKWKA